MLVIDDQAKIARALNQLANRLKDDGEFMGEREIPFRSGFEVAPLYWFEKHRLWWAYAEGPHKHWNSFGIVSSERELEPKPPAPICQINFPIDDPTYKTAGAFAREGEDRLYVVHDGGVGGGRRGIGQKAFQAYTVDKLDWWPCGWYTGVSKKVVRISLLDDANLVANIGDFTAIVDEFKRSVA